MATARQKIATAQIVIWTVDVSESRRKTAQIATA